MGAVLLDALMAAMLGVALVVGWRDRRRRRRQLARVEIYPRNR